MPHPHHLFQGSEGSASGSPDDSVASPFCSFHFCWAVTETLLYKVQVWHGTEKLNKKRYAKKGSLRIMNSFTFNCPQSNNPQDHTVHLAAFNKSFRFHILKNVQSVIIHSILPLEYEAFLPMSLQQLCISLVFLRCCMASVRE